MSDILQILKSFTNLITDLITQIGSFFKIVGQALAWVPSLAVFMPLYMRLCLSVLVAVTVLLFVFNRG